MSMVILRPTKGHGEKVSIIKNRISNFKCLPNPNLEVFKS